MSRALRLALAPFIAIAAMLGAEPSPVDRRRRDEVEPTAPPDYEPVRVFGPDGERLPRIERRQGLQLADARPVEVTPARPSGDCPDHCGDDCRFHGPMRRKLARRAARAGRAGESW